MDDPVTTATLRTGVQPTSEHRFEMKRLNYCATLGDAADGLVRDVEIAGPAWFQSG